MEILNISDTRTMLPDDKKIVFISGVTGQDGSHMVDYLLENTDHFILGGARRLSIKNHRNLDHLENEERFKLVNFDLTDPHGISKLVETTTPDYFINFAAQSHVGISWDFPEQTLDCNTKGVISILEAIRNHAPKCRFYNAGSSEEFGDVMYSPQDDRHPSRPVSPYGASKVAARGLVKVWRDSYKLYAIQGLLFNHEGTRRGEGFVTRKITKGVGRIKAALLRNDQFKPIELGNILSKRDWSDSVDFMDGVWRMLNQEQHRTDNNGGLREYILSSQETHTIKEFVEEAFRVANIQGNWHGVGLNEEFSITHETHARYDATSSTLVKIDPKFYRPAEVKLLCGNSTPARNELKWTPKSSFKQLVRKMVEHDEIPVVDSKFSQGKSFSMDGTECV
jgi:GDPmannose 4,6-dehydratase